MKKLLIGLTICLISVCMLGCQSVAREDDVAFKPVSDIPVITENDANRETNSKPESQPDSRVDMILETDAEKIAFEAAKKAITTVPYWKDVKIKNIKCIRTELTEYRPYYVYPLDNYPNEPLPFGAGQLDLKGLKYAVLFQDTGDVSSFLYIYVDPITGEVIGCKYTSD